MDVILGYPPEVDTIDLRGYFFVQIHPWRGDDVLDPRTVYSLVLPDLLFCLEQAWTSGDPDRFQAWGHSETDGLVCAGLISDKKVCFQRIESSGLAFDGGIKGLEIDADVCFPAFHAVDNMEDGGSFIFARKESRMAARAVSAFLPVRPKPIVYDGA